MPTGQFCPNRQAYRHGLLYLKDSRDKPNMLIHSVAARSNAVSWIGSTILLAWLIYLLVAPTIGFGWIESWHNEQRAVQIVLLAFTAVAYCVIGMLTRSDESVARWQLPALLLVFLALGLVSALRAQFVFAALAEVSMFALLAILAMLTARVVSTDVARYVRWARWFALLFATGLCPRRRDALSGGGQPRTRDRPRRVDPRLCKSALSECIARRTDSVSCADRARKNGAALAARRRGSGFVTHVGDQPRSWDARYLVRLRDWYSRHGRACRMAPRWRALWRF